MARNPITETQADNPAAGIGFILLGVMLITVNDTLVKALSDRYALHQLIFIRSVIGGSLTLLLVAATGRGAFRWPRRPGLHALRGLLIVLANLLFFAGLAALPLAEATALFFVAPLLITVLSIPLLGERVGPRRLLAVALGFAGVLLMVRPWAAEAARDSGLIVSLLPVAGATAYALFQILTRRLGAGTSGPMLALWAQASFLLVSVAFFLAVGDGRFAPGPSAPARDFVLRAWAWPAPVDWLPMLALGLIAGVVAVSLSQAYRLADAGLIAPFEYAALPIAVLWGWAVFGEWPEPRAWAGIALIVGAGLFVFWREGHAGRPQPGTLRD